MIRSCRRFLKGSVHVAAFFANEMREQWEPFWTPSLDNRKENADLVWLIAAEAAGLEAKRGPQWIPAKRKAFHYNVKLAIDVADMDGLQADEAKALAQHYPWLIDELYDLFVRSVRHDGGSIDAELSQAILGWRVVGVPKRAPAESRRIAIASVLLRAWHRTVADTLPQLPEQQWSELGFGRVFSNLLEFQGLNDAEVDEEKAFDMIQHEVAKIALLFGGAPNIVAE